MSLRSRLDKIGKQLSPPPQRPSHVIILGPEIDDETTRYLVFDARGQPMNWEGTLPENVSIKHYVSDENGETIFDLV